MNMVLIGPPGVGKGTQAAMLDDRLGMRQLSSGLIFRTEIEAQTDLGNLAKRYIDQGRLVPNGVTIEMMAKKLRDPETRKRGFVLDGYPRTVEQAKALDLLMEEMGLCLDQVVSLSVEDHVVVERLSKRIGCTKCGAIYHSVHKPPKREGICDSCNSPLFVRSDDRPDAILERLRTFREATAPVIGYYHEKGILKVVDAALDPEAIYLLIVEKDRSA